MTALIAVAHGSRDSRSSRTVHAAVDVLCRRRPDLDVRVAFLDLTAPSVDDVIDDLVACGHREAVAVPMLLGKAFHARVDLPALITSALGRHPQLTLVQSNVLGDDRLLVDAVRKRILEAGGAIGDPSLGIALAAVGSSHAPANQRTRTIAPRLLNGTGWAGAITCFATSAQPSADAAVEQLRAMGASRVIVAPWFLAPGLLTDRVKRSLTDHPDVLHAEVIGSHRSVAEVISSRYDAAVQQIRATRRTA